MRHSAWAVVGWLLVGCDGGGIEQTTTTTVEAVTSPDPRPTTPAPAPDPPEDPECPDNAHLQGQDCVCDPGFVPAADCGSCEVDVDADGCPPNAWPLDGQCVCKLGYGVNDAGCACENVGSVGASCLTANDCDVALQAFFYPVCLKSFQDFIYHGDVGTSFPGGMCSTAHCLGYDGDNCVALGGVCLELGSSFGGDRLGACLVPCGLDAECRDGYVCRALTEDEHWAATNQRFCLLP